ncbi:MAG TPA: hypothetical protein VN902_17785 [Candidatus Acidoferrales bacterium]|nr:hypothetical protein [Candidatus Acidoferrales bacterium]
MKLSFDETLIGVWRQALVDEADVVKVGSDRYPVTQSKAKRLRQVAFVFGRNTIMGIEQNPKTKSRWAAMARAGKKVMQFIQDGRYIAVVADGKVIMYGKSRAG